MLEYLLVTGVSLLAGFIDSIVGGGGLILVPALFAIFPGAAPATLFGTNKGASVWGTSMATWQYAQRVQLRWSVLLPATVAGFIFSMAGAYIVTIVSPNFLRKVLPIILLAVLLYTLANKHLGQTHEPRFQGRAEIYIACLIGALLGFYDGFFGPGTGSFFVFLFVRWLGYDFLNASASAKLLNTGTNLAALILFAIKGHVWWHFVLWMAIANVIGSYFGARFAMKMGAGFVRIVFIGIVSLLIMRTGYDAYIK